jgi:hypothetical protein
MNAVLVTNFSKENRVIVGFQQRFLQTFEGGIAFSNKDLEPRLGINVLNVIKLHIGYSFPYQNKLYQSVTFGVVLALGPKNYYDHLVIGF